MLKYYSLLMYILCSMHPSNGGFFSTCNWEHGHSDLLMTSNQQFERKHFFINIYMYIHVLYKWTNIIFWIANKVNN